MTTTSEYGDFVAFHEDVLGVRLIWSIKRMGDFLRHAVHWGAFTLHHRVMNSMGRSELDRVWIWFILGFDDASLQLYILHYCTRTALGGYKPWFLQFKKTCGRFCNQTWQWKMDHLQVILLRKPPFRGDFPLPCLITWWYMFHGLCGFVPDLLKTAKRITYRTYGNSLPQSRAVNDEKRCCFLFHTYVAGKVIPSGNQTRQWKREWCSN